MHKAARQTKQPPALEVETKEATKVLACYFQLPKLRMLSTVISKIAKIVELSFLG